jgi:hypothetical protein
MLLPQITGKETRRVSFGVEAQRFPARFFAIRQTRQSRHHSSGVQPEGPSIAYLPPTIYNLAEGMPS